MHPCRHSFKETNHKSGGDQLNLITMAGEQSDQLQWQALQILKQAKESGNLLPAIQDELKGLVSTEVRSELKKTLAAGAEVDKQTPDGILREWAKTLPTVLTSETIQKMQSSVTELAKKHDRLIVLQLSPNLIRFAWKINTIPGDIGFYQFEYNYKEQKWEFNDIGVYEWRYSEIDKKSMLVALAEMWQPTQYYRR